MENKKTKKEIAKIVLTVFLLLCANLLFFLLIWLLGRYDSVQLDQILYQLKTSMQGTSTDLAGNAILEIFSRGILLTVAEIPLYFLLSDRFMGKLKRCKAYVKYTATRVCGFFKKRALTLTSSLLALSMLFFIIMLEVPAYTATTATKSKFIENHYVDPNSVEITFPEEKRNLIYIFVESMENTFADPSAGGLVTDSFIPELVELANENVSFSNTDGIGGALSFAGTTWTAAAMFAQTSGVIIKVPLTAESYGGENSYMPGITSLGNILENQGYNQTLLIGSDGRFAGRDSYFSEHGNYNIVDINSLKAEGRLPEDYFEWWGFRDSLLFEYAKEELGKLAKEDKPFNFTLLTADSHFPNGFVCEKCPDTHEEQYANVLSCTSRQVYEFVNWIKEQPYYENTTIVICGDHLTMDPEFLEDIDKDYVRTVYNCIINSAFPAKKTKNRQFATFDMFPTTLSAMGVTVEGERLGLGTNLFSDKMTLTEEYGFEYLNKELQKKSEFYIDNLLEDEE